MVSISIIIPVYNVAKYLPECLESIINQTFKDFEVICVNDGSKDNSLEVLEFYKQKDSRIKVISKENGGAGSARNKGLDFAQGKYIQFLDGDDYFEPQMLEKLYNLAEKHNTDISVCSSRKVDDEGNITESRNPNSPINLDRTPFDKPFSKKDFPNEIFGLIGTVPWNKLYRKDLIDKYNLKFPDLTGPDDLCFVFTADACAEKIAVIDDELINYRYNRAGSVQTYRANHASDIIRAALFVKDFLLKNNFWTLLKNSYLQSFITSVRWETSLCNDSQYEKFLQDLKTLMPDDWEIFSPALKKNKITLDYLNGFIGEKKVFLWGAGIFTQKLLAEEKIKNPNILGIIDRNIASWGSKLGNYEIFSPEILNKSDADGVLLMVLNNNETIYPALKKELSKTNPKLELLPNIFD